MLSRTRKTTVITNYTPILEFLAPSLIQPHRVLPASRCLSTTSRQRQSAVPGITTPPISNPPEGHHEGGSTHTPKSGKEAASNPAPLSKPLTQAQRDFLSSALRVNQAGELAATLIYTAQTPPLVTAHPHLRPLMKHMHAQEAAHLTTFSSLLSRHRIRPTAMYPIWSLAASALGWTTAVLGREAAMACTEAVETEIGSHYNAQVGALLEMVRKMEAAGEEVGGELRELVRTLRRIRDEELEHLDHAVENDAKMAVPYEVLTRMIRSGCKGAIWVSERV